MDEIHAPLLFQDEMQETLVLLLWFGMIGLEKGDSLAGKEGPRSMAPPESLSEIIRAHSDKLMTVRGVIGVGEGQHRGKPCVIVFVEKKTSALVRKIPAHLDGHPVIVKEVGKVKPLKR